ncbi:MAG: hypothetical protein ACPG05_02730 [Bdellovibrionales bacterium]
MAIMRCLIGYSVAGAAYVASVSASYAEETLKIITQEAKETLDADLHDAVHEVAEITHEASGGLPQFDPTWFASQVFWLAISFTLLYVVFAKKTLPSISSTIDRRRQQIESDIETTEELTKESEGVYEAYQKNLQESQAAARSVIADMEADLKAKAEEAHAKFRDKAEKTISKTEDAIKKAKEEALKDVEAVAAEIALETTKKLVSRDVDPKNVKSIVSTLSKGASSSKTTKKAA